MQPFLQLHIKLACSLAVLISILLMQLPEQQTHYSRYSLDKWVEQHLELEPEKLPDAAPAPREENSPKLPPPADGSLISQLYIAWTQHQGAADMAGVFVQDRVMAHIIQKFGYGPSPDAVLPGKKGYEKIIVRAGQLLHTSPAVSSLAQLPGLSGTFINAP